MSRQWGTTNPGHPPYSPRSPASSSHSSYNHRQHHRQHPSQQRKHPSHSSSFSHHDADTVFRNNLYPHAHAQRHSQQQQQYSCDSFSSTRSSSSPPPLSTQTQSSSSSSARYVHHLMSSSSLQEKHSEVMNIKEETQNRSSSLKSVENHHEPRQQFVDNDNRNDNRNEKAVGGQQVKLGEEPEDEEASFFSRNIESELHQTKQKLEHATAELNGFQNTLLQVQEKMRKKQYEIDDLKLIQDGLVHLCQRRHALHSKFKQSMQQLETQKQVAFTGTATAVHDDLNLNVNHNQLTTTEIDVEIERKEKTIRAKEDKREKKTSRSSPAVTTPTGTVVEKVSCSSSKKKSVSSSNSNPAGTNDKIKTEVKDRTTRARDDTIAANNDVDNTSDTDSDNSTTRYSSTSANNIRIAKRTTKRSKKNDTRNDRDDDHEDRDGPEEQDSMIPTIQRRVTTTTTTDSNSHNINPRIFLRPHVQVLPDTSQRKLRTIDFNPKDPNLLATSSDDGQLLLWNLTSSASSSSSSSRRRLSSSSSSSRSHTKLQLHRVASFSSMNPEAPCYESIAWSPCGKKLALACRDATDEQGAVYISDFQQLRLRSCEKLSAPLVHRRGMSCVKWMSMSPGSYGTPSLPVTAGPNHTVMLWKPPSSSSSSSSKYEPHLIHDLHKSEIRSLCIPAVATGNAMSIYSGGLDGLVIKYDMQRKKSSMILQRRHKPVGVEKINAILDRDPHTLLASCLSSGAQELVFCDLRSSSSGSGSGHLRIVIGGGGNNKPKLSQYILPSLSPDGQYVSCGSASGVVYLWDIRALRRGKSHAVATTEPHQTIAPHTKQVTQAVFHPTRNALISLSTDRSIGLTTYERCI